MNLHGYTSPEFLLDEFHYGAAYRLVLSSCLTFMHFEISIGYENQLLIYKVVSIDQVNFWAILANRETITDYTIPTLVLLEKGEREWRSNSTVPEIVSDLVVAIDHYLEVPGSPFNENGEGK